tara:strand:- start:11 stop:436 length:426 start_codon:yes stop_codon:yes gene_type:complete
MPKSKVRKSRKFREFSKLDDRYLRRNYLKYYRTARLDFCDNHEISGSHLDFLVWAYDLEFFTMDYASLDYEISKRKIGDRIIYPLTREGYVYKHFNRLTPSNTADDHLFREETKMNYRVRYAITQKARMLVQAFYRHLEDY